MDLAELVAAMLANVRTSHGIAILGKPRSDRPANALRAPGY